jgi:hypothetical protein
VISNATLLRLECLPRNSLARQQQEDLIQNTNKTNLCARTRAARETMNRLAFLPSYMQFNSKFIFYEKQRKRSAPNKDKKSERWRTIILKANGIQFDLLAAGDLRGISFVRRARINNISWPRAISHSLAARARTRGVIVTV